MGLFIRYFGIEWKQSWKVWLKTLIAGLVVATLLIAAAVGVTAVMKHLSAFEAVRVGMVIPEEAADEDTMFAVSFLTAMDSVKSVGSLLLLKGWLLHIGTYLQLAAMLLVAFTITQTALPDTDNVTVGIVSNDSARAEKIYERLRAFSDVYEFVAVDTEEELRESVECAKLECGFAFDEDFDRMTGSGNLTGFIRFYSSQTTNKGSAVAEMVYASVLEEYSSELLTAAQQKLYNEENPERQEKIMERFYGYLDSEDVFAVNLCQVETDAVTADAKEAVYPLQGLLGMLVALEIFLLGLRRFEPGSSFYKGLDKRDVKRFFAGCVCSGNASRDPMPCHCPYKCRFQRHRSRAFSHDRILCVYGFVVCAGEPVVPQLSGDAGGRAGICCGKCVDLSGDI